MNNKQIRYELVKWISSKDNKYEFTITFFDGTSNCVAEKTLSTLFKFLNQRLFSRRYIKKKLFLNGVAIREIQLNNTLHYHCLINNHQNNLPEFELFKATLAKCIKKLTLPQNPAQRIIGDKCWEMQEYYNDGSNKLENYITKNLELKNMTLQEAYDSIGIIDCENICFGDSPKRRILLTKDYRHRNIVH